MSRISRLFRLSSSDWLRWSVTSSRLEEVTGFGGDKLVLPNSWGALFFCIGSWLVPYLCTDRELSKLFNKASIFCFGKISDLFPFGWLVVSGIFADYLSNGEMLMQDMFSVPQFVVRSGRVVSGSILSSSASSFMTKGL